MHQQKYPPSLRYRRTHQKGDDASSGTSRPFRTTGKTGDLGVFHAGRKQAQMAMIRNRKRIVRCLFIISYPPVYSGKNGEHYAGKVKELWKRGKAQ